MICSRAATWDYSLYLRAYLEKKQNIERIFAIFNYCCGGFITTGFNAQDYHWGQPMR
jgi:hypothetical protein